MSQLLNDVRYAVRSLAKTPGTSLLMIATLAVGLAADVRLAGLRDASDHALADGVALGAHPLGDAGRLDHVQVAARRLLARQHDLRKPADDRGLACTGNEALGHSA